ncbi:MAG TPA: ATP-binding cassette domain-containing protein [Phenylobacterium sp.]
MSPSSIRLENLGHGIVDGGHVKTTLAPLTCQFEAGKFHVVTGPSGVGKTTLLSLLSLFVRATSGDLFWGDETLSGLSQQDAATWRRRHLGLIFQTSRLVGVMTAEEHIAMAARVRDLPEARSEGLRLLDSLQIGDKRGHRPGALSGGEKQRVAIAQALCARPSVLLADEPTASLDRTNAIAVADTLRTYAVDVDAVVVCVTHDHSVIERADAVLHLQKP